MSNVPFDPKGEFPANPYAASSGGTPPTAVPQGPPPRVIFWQKVYLGVMVAIYLLVMCGGVALFLFADTMGANEDMDMGPGEAKLMGGIYGGLGLVFMILFALGFVFRKGMLGWVFNLILIAIALTSCCFWPACIPMLIYWVKEKDAILYHS